MSVAGPYSPAAGFTHGDDRFDDVACLPASVWGFDLRPYREPRVDRRRKRSRLGWLAALCGGLAGAVLLHVWAQHERRLDDERAATITREVSALAPALSELEAWQALIDKDHKRQARQAALTPRRTQLLRLLDLLAAATRTGVRVTDMQVQQDDRLGPAEPVDQSVSTDVRMRIEGLADDADGLAQWTAHLASQIGVLSVDLDAVRRLDARRPEPRVDLRVKGPTRAPHEVGANALEATDLKAPNLDDAPQLNAFRLTLVWRDPEERSAAFQSTSAAPSDRPSAELSAALAGELPAAPPAALPETPTTVARGAS